MNDAVTYRLQKWLAWSGPVMVVTYLVFWIVLGHNFPPPSASLSAADLVSQYYAPHRHDIMLGMSVCAACGMIYLPWSVQLTVQMWRREKVPVLALMQLTGGLLTAWVLAMCPAIWAWCARYSTEGVDPQIIKAAHFIAWYIYDMTYTVTTVQLLGCGLFAILDRKTPLLFPRWAGWVALWTAFSFLALTALPYFDHGPLAFNGWWNFYLVFGSWGVWFTTYSVFMFKDIERTRLRAPQAMAQTASYGIAE